MQSRVNHPNACVCFRLTDPLLLLLYSITIICLSFLYSARILLILLLRFVPPNYVFRYRLDSIELILHKFGHFFASLGMYDVLMYDV